MTDFKKVSEIFLKFAAPICDVVPENLAAEEYQKTLLVPMAVWNAVSPAFFGEITGSSVAFFGDGCIP